MEKSSEQIAFAQLAFIRNLTLQIAVQVPVDLVDRIPDGQRNHIRWQLAHMWDVLERYVFHIALQTYPEHDEELKLYGYGSSPENWVDAEIPDVAEWIKRLAAQPARIEMALTGLLDITLTEPFTFDNGYTVTTARELLNYGLYHEGLHLSMINSYLKMLQHERR